MTTLVLTEKPKVAKRIASILSKNAKQHKIGRLTYYTFELDGEEYIVVPAAGHLLELDYPEGEWVYPMILPPDDLILREIESKSQFLRVIERLGRKADRIIVATDLDAEGSSIALEIMKALGWEKTKEICRMEFSSLNAEEIRRAFKDLKPFDYPRANAGWARRVLDLQWGANVSRGLTLSTRKRSWVRVLSSGSVQGPTLSLIVRREREIRSFIPKKYYVVTAIMEGEKGKFEMRVSPPRGEEKIWKREYAEKAAESIRGKVLKAKVKSRKVTIKPPPPFDGTSMQVEVSRITGLTPKQIADRSSGIAQQLYEAGLISYIGTESQKYPKNWKKDDFVKMVEIIRSYSPLREDASFVLNDMRDHPVEGTKDDPAHPTIHVVGAPDEDFRSKNHRRVYEIIARRNLATLSPDAVVKRVNVEVEVDSFKFKASGAALLEEGWLRVYPYAKKDYSMPQVENGEEIRCVDVRIEEKETQPPKRYTPISIIKEMERLGLGTKNTRVQILDILKEREYIEGKSFKPTPLGEAVAEVLEEYVPDLTSPDLTSKLEEAMNRIEMGELDHKAFLSDALAKLEDIMKDFKSKEGLISEKLAKAVQEYRNSQYTVGTCPECGRELLLKKSKYGYFVICSGYPKECDVKYNILPGERILKEHCKCGLPLVEGRIKTKSNRTLKYTRCLGNCDESPVRCAKCGGVMVPKKGRYGVYLQCKECGSVNFFRVRKR